MTYHSSLVPLLTFPFRVVDREPFTTHSPTVTGSSEHNGCDSGRPPDKPRRRRGPTPRRPLLLTRRVPTRETRLGPTEGRGLTGVEGPGRRRRPLVTQGPPADLLLRSTGVHNDVASEADPEV